MHALTISVQSTIPTARSARFDLPARSLTTSAHASSSCTYSIVRVSE